MASVKIMVDQMSELSYTKKMLLRELSEDSRVSVTELAKKLRISRNTVTSNIRWLEKEFGMRYTVEFDISRFGSTILQFSFLKFGIKPSAEDLKDAFKGSEDYIVFLAACKGDSDAIIKTISTSSADYMYWAVGIYLKLARFKPVVRSSVVNTNIIGFMPIPPNIINKLDTGYTKLDSIDKRMLLMLNSNSRASYEDMARALNVKVETVRYRMKIIKESALIKRCTIILTRPPTTHNIAYYYRTKLTDRAIDFYRKSLDYYANADGRLPATNSFVYIASAVGSYSTIGIGSFEDSEIASGKVTDALTELYGPENIDLSHSKIEEVIYGNIPVRSIDIEREAGKFKSDLRTLKLWDWDTIVK